MSERETEENGTDDEGQSVFEQAKADARKKYEGRDLKTLALEMAEWRRRKAECEKDLHKINGFYDVLRFEAIPQKMDADGLENVRYDGIGQIVLTPDINVGTKPGMKQRLYDWLRKQKAGDLITPTVNSSTLKAWLRKRIRDGKSMPTEYVNVTPVTRASIRK